MKKILLVLGIFLSAFLAGAYNANYGAIGAWMYQGAMQLESASAGFSKHQADIGEMEMTYYLASNPGKPTLLMLHGYSANKDVWVRFAKHFTKDYQVVIPDLAGHGETPFKQEWSYGMPAQAKRVVALLDHLKIEKAHIIGNSMGGFLTATMGVRYPERAASVVMMDAAGVMSPKPSELYEMVMAGKNPFLVHNRQEFERFFGMTMHKRPFTPSIIIEAVSNDYIARRDQLAKIFADFSESDYLENELDKITMPAMVWWGDKDRLLDISAVPLWQAGIPHLQVKIFENIGHMPMMEVPKESAQVYKEFLESL